MMPSENLIATGPYPTDQVFWDQAQTHPSLLDPGNLADSRLQGQWSPQP